MDDKMKQYKKELNKEALFHGMTIEEANAILNPFMSLRTCETCNLWEDDNDGVVGQCYYLEIDEDICINDEGVPGIGKTLEEMDEIINKVIEASWIETHKDFGCIYWKQVESSVIIPTSRIEDDGIPKDKD